jgi:hypothetical protein
MIELSIPWSSESSVGAASAFGEVGAGIWMTPGGTADKDGNGCTRGARSFGRASVDEDAKRRGCKKVRLRKGEGG